MAETLPIESFAVVGLSHKTAPVELRERLVLSGDALDVFYRQLLERGPCDGALILSTCNRVEVYTVTAQQAEVQQWIRKELISRGGEDVQTNVTYCYSGIEAIAHLFRVTSGLDSMILGEPQIAGQVKESYAQAIKMGATNGLLNQLAHRAFNVAKKVRSETAIQSQPVSVPYTAVLLAEQIFGNLNEKRVLLIGAGQMSELAATHLVDRRIANLLIMNRHSERAAQLAERFEAEVWPFERLSDALDESDIVISSTAAKEALVSVEQVREVMRHRKNKPMFFIDLGVPRDIDPEVNELMNCYVFDIDDLQQVVDGNLEERQGAAAEAEKLIREEVAIFFDYLQARDVSPVITDLMNQVESLRASELDKLFRRYPELEEEVRRAIAQTTDGVLKKLLHPALHWLKGENGDFSREERTGIFKRLFGMNRALEDPQRKP